MFKSVKYLFFVLFLIPLLTLTIVSCDSDDSSDDDDTGAGDDTTEYFIKVKIDGVETTFEGGFTEAGSKPVASYDADDDQSSIYAFSPSVSYASMDSGNGLMFTDIEGKTTGSFTCNVVYYNDGTTSAAANCKIDISAYGAEGEAVTGSMPTGFVAGGKTFTDCTFNVYNSGDE